MALLLLIFNINCKLRLEGNVVGNLFEKEQYSVIRLVYPGSRKLSITDINNQQIFLPNGRLKPIHELATVIINPGDAEIQRSNLQSMGVVTADLENRDLGSVMKDVQEKISSELTLPAGYYIEYGGAYAEQQKSFKRIIDDTDRCKLACFFSDTCFYSNRSKWHC